jgi:UDP-N-acetylmuramoyl-tripeptide--D-alanyl-D-alanine ligase
VSTAVSSVALAACVVACVLAGLRWLRVAQREHYLAGAASRFAWRWWVGAPLDASLAAVAVAGALASVAEPATACATAVVAAVGPFGLGLRGRTSPLAWTRRLRTVAAALGLAVAVVVGGAAALGGLTPAVVAAALSVAFLPPILDVVLALLAPLEERVAARFVQSAAERVRRVAPTVVAITGSYGKTTTKGYVAHLLAASCTVVASPRSFNNTAGLARTVNELLVPGTDVLVAEMGTYGVGEIAALCAWLPPKISVITAIGPVHLERFKSLDTTLLAKSEITVHAEVSVLNVDDGRLAALARRLEDAGRTVVRCSAHDLGADVAVLAEQGGATLYRRGSLVGTVHLAEGGAVSAPSNVACALGVAFALGVDERVALERVAALPVAANRLEVSTSPSGVAVVDDTYNSNPAGASLALAALTRAGHPGGRRVVVTPGMVELGPMQVRENERFATSAASVATDVVVIGRTNRRALERGLAAARAGGVEVAVHWQPTRDSAVAFVRAELGPGDAVLYENDLPDHYP